jgi:hypothetical protein
MVRLIMPDQSSALPAAAIPDREEVMADDSRPPQASGGSAHGVLSVPALPSGAERVEALCERLERAERRLQEMADGYGAVLGNLSEVDRKHTSTVAALNERLGDWCDLERKLLEESARRIERFERGVGHEWTVLRRMHEESIQSVHEQAGEIRRLCGEATGAVQLRLEAAEGDYANRATALEQQMREWVRRLFEVGQVSGAVEAAADADGSDAGPGVPRTSAGPAQPWSLEGVAQLHQEMRGGGPGPDQPRPAPDPAAATEPGRKPAAPAIGSDAGPAADSLAVYRGMGYGSPRGRRTRLAWAAAIAGVALVSAIFVYAGSLRSRINDLEARSRAAARQANDERNRLREAAEQQAQSASRAEALVQILAAPDLYRLPLAGLEPAPNAFGQALWSKSRGVAVTASRLPSAPDGKIYRAWAIGPAAATGLGLLNPDADGRATLVTTAAPAGAVRPLWIVITLEDSPDGAQPTGKRFLASPQALAGGGGAP